MAPPDGGWEGGGAARLGERLGLDEEELCGVLGVGALELVSGEADTRPELAVLHALLDEAEASVSEAAVRRWVRTRGPAGRPLDRLLGHDFAGFEDAVAALMQRGFVIGG